MLLASLISNQQSAYAEIQAQIEQLQEQQRQIQAYLQQLGSVESQMVSAAQMLAEAIASIRNVCPDELSNYQATISGLFGDAPVAQLSASIEPEPEIQPQPEPEPDEPQTVDIVAESQGVVANGNGTNGNGHGADIDYSLLVGIEKLKKCDRAILIKLANRLKVANYKNLKNLELATALADKVTEYDLNEVKLTKSSK